MTSEVPPEIDEVISRIALPEPQEPALPEDVTGELRALVQWWTALAPTRAVRASTLAAGGDWATAHAAVLGGIDAADRAVDAGATLLVPRCAPSDHRAARAVVCLLARVEPQSSVPQPEGMADRRWMADVAAVREDTARLGDRRAEPLDVLDELGAAPLGFAVGVLLAGAARRTPCLLDGTDELAAALVADRLSSRAKAWWACGATSTDPARTAAADRVGLFTGLPLGLSDDRGRGARTALAVLTAALED